MKCDRCGKRKHVERHEIDGYTGHLCDECREKWAQLQNND